MRKISSYILESLGSKFRTGIIQMQATQINTGKKHTIIFLSIENDLVLIFQIDYPVKQQYLWL